MSLPQGIRKHHGRYQIRYWGKDGKQHTESRVTITAAKLRQHEIAVELDKKTWRDPRVAKVPFGLYAESYLAQKLRLRPRTRAKYDRALRNHLEPAFGKTPIGASAETQFRSGWHRRCATGSPPRPCEATTLSWPQC